MTLNAADVALHHLEAGHLTPSAAACVADPPLDSILSKVTWEGPHDQANPQNWSMKKKWGATLTISLFSLIAPVSSSMVAPCLPAIASEFAITNSVTVQLVLSIFVLAWGCGPLILGPLSEVYGRSPVLQLANLFYLIFNLACGFSTSAVQIIIFRFLSGFGGSAPLAVR